MNIKAAFKYQRNEWLKTVRNFYIIIFLIIALFTLSVKISSNSSMSMGGVEMTTMIFLFVVGLNSFKETFLMMVQNSVSRKTILISTIITMLSASAFMAVIDRLLINVGGLYSVSYDNVMVTGLYDMIFEKRLASMHKLPHNLEAILITGSLYMSVLSVGYFITTAYYRMNKVVKVAVSVGVPASLFILLPVLDATVFAGKISSGIINFFKLITGGESGSPYNLLISCILFSLVCFGLVWLLIRRAVEKTD